MFFFLHPNVGFQRGLPLENLSYTYASQTYLLNIAKGICVSDMTRIE